MDAQISYLSPIAQVGTLRYSLLCWLEPEKKYNFNNNEIAVILNATLLKA